MKAIEIPINNKLYRLTPVGVNYNLDEVMIKKDKEVPKSLGYSMTLSKCLDLIAKDNIGSDDEVLSLKDYVDALSDRYTELKDIVEFSF